MTISRLPRNMNKYMKTVSVLQKQGHIASQAKDGSAVVYLASSYSAWSKCVIESANKLIRKYLQENKPLRIHAPLRANFIFNPCSAFTAYCFFANESGALPVYVKRQGKRSFSCVSYMNSRILFSMGK